MFCVSFYFFFVLLYSSHSSELILEKLLYSTNTNPPTLQHTHTLSSNVWYVPPSSPANPATGTHLPEEGTQKNIEKSLNKMNSTRNILAGKLSLLLFTIYL